MSAKIVALTLAKGLCEVIMVVCLLGMAWTIFPHAVEWLEMVR